MHITHERPNHSRLGALLFVVGWLFGNGAFALASHGTGNEFAAAVWFWLCCGVWWAGFRLGGFESSLGTGLAMGGLGLWVLDAVMYGLSFSRPWGDLFLWASALGIVTLVFSMWIVQKRAEHFDASSGAS
jgi:hypothetical protein